MKNKELKILLSAPRGFCAGVERAIEIVEKSIQKFGAPVYVRHEIVHNKYVVDDLKNKGAIFVEELEEINDKSRPVIFSAHGVPKKIPEDAKNCDMFFVIGSRNSSNSVRLVEVAKKSGCENSQLIHSESSIPYDQIENCNTIGISSGASAPEILVENFINNLKNKFSISIDEIEIIKEDVVFKVPKKLN